MAWTQCTSGKGKIKRSEWPLLGLPLVLWTPSKSAIMRWEVCNENEEKALQC